MDKNLHIEIHRMAKNQQQPGRTQAECSRTGVKVGKGLKCSRQLLSVFLGQE